MTKKKPKRSGHVKGDTKTSVIWAANAAVIAVDASRRTTRHGGEGS